MKREDKGLLNLIGIFVIIFLIGLAGAWFSEAKASTELWGGINFDHLSQLDAGSPFNNNNEDSVDHLGLFGEVRYPYEKGYLYFGISLGRNDNFFGCSKCWDDGGAEIDTRVYLGYSILLKRW